MVLHLRLESLIHQRYTHTHPTPSQPGPGRGMLRSSDRGDRGPAASPADLRGSCAPRSASPTEEEAPKIDRAKLRTDTGGFVVSNSSWWEHQLIS